MEWPTWELQAHGSAAPAPDLAAPDDPVGARGPGCPLPRLDPLGPWCSARLTFADGARVDVLVTVSDDHITVEDVRADPPLTLDGLADLARWIDGPLDDAFRAATGQPRKSRGGPRQPGSAAGVLGGGGGAQAGTAPGRASASEPAGAGAGAAAAEGATHPTAEAVEAEEAEVPGRGRRVRRGSAMARAYCTARRRRPASATRPIRLPRRPPPRPPSLQPSGPAIRAPGGPSPRRHPRPPRRRRPLRHPRLTHQRRPPTPRRHPHRPHRLPPPRHPPPPRRPAVPAPSSSRGRGPESVARSLRMRTARRSGRAAIRCRPSCAPPAATADARCG